MKLLGLQARTASETAPYQTNLRFTGVMIFLNVTVMPSGGLTLRVLGKDSLGQQYYLNGAPTKVTAVGQYIYIISPGLSTGGSVAQAVSAQLPKDWSIRVFADDGTSITYSVEAQMLR